MRTKMCPFRFIRVFLVIAALLACAAGADAGGGTRHYVTQSGDGSRNGDDWENAYGEAEFPAAILSAAAGHEIWVAKGVYRPSITNDATASFVLKNGVAIYGGFDGTETSSADRDPAANFTVLTGDLTNNDTNKVNGVTVSADQINGPNSTCVVRAGSGCGPTTVLDGFTITAGENTTGNGGGMYNDHSSPAVTNCAFSGNSAVSYGGGMFTYAGSPAVTNCTFSGNTAGSGGGMCNDSSSPVVTNCTFSGNSALSYGGGGMFNYAGSPTVTNCTFSGNTAEYGGGMYNFNTGAPAVTNCTFSGNTASSNGGGMFNDDSSPTVRNCIFRNVSGGEIYNQGSAPDVSYCVVSGDDVGTGTVSSNIVSADPLLGPLADNGGPTKTHALLPGSPAIDKGKTFAASVISTDQRGAPRPYPSGGSFDIGAYECGPVILTVEITGSGSVTRDPSGDVVGDTGKCWGYPNGTPVTLTVVDGAHGFFATWSGDATSSADTVTVTMSCDHAVEAVFDLAWIITVSAGPGGDITSSDSGAGSAGLSAPGNRGAGTTEVKVRNDRNKTFTVTPNAGYSIGPVRVDGVIKILGAGSTYTLTNVTEDHALEATFTANPTPVPTATPTDSPAPTAAPTPNPSVTPTPIPTPDPDIPLPTVTLTITLYAGGTIVSGPFDITDPATLSALLVSPTLLAQLLATDPAAILSGTYNMDLVRFFSLVADLDDGVLDFTLLFEVKVDGVPSGYRAQLFMLKRTFDSKGNPTGYAVVPRFEGGNVFRKKSTSRGWTETWCVTIHDGGASDGDAKRDGSVAPQIAAIVAVFPAESPTVTPTQGSTGGGGCTLPALPGAASGVLLAALLLAPLLFARRR